MKSVWNGAIGFGLVNIPVKVYLATHDAEPPLHSLCKNGHRIVYKRWCPVENREVSWQEIKKGFQLSADKFVVLEKEDLEKIKIPSTKRIEIKEFVDTSQLDPIYVERSYYVAPDKGGSHAYFLLLSAMGLLNKLAVGTLTMSEREHIVALRPYQNSLLMHTLHYADEVVPVEDISELKNQEKPEKKELELAQLLIQKMSKEAIGIEQFKDTYVEALRELIKAKAAGKEYEIKAEKEVKAAKSLIDSLTESLKQ